MNWKELLESQLDALEERAREYGAELQHSLDEVKSYASAQMAMVEASVGEPGFNQAVRAAEANILTYAALKAVQQGDALDARAETLRIEGVFFIVRAVATIIATL